MLAEIFDPEGFVGHLTAQQLDTLFE